MKRMFFLLLLLLAFNSTQAQTLNPRFSEHIYLGASKAELIDFVVLQAFEYYMNNTDDVIKKQKKEGVKLKKQEDMVEFLNEMETDMRRQLQKEDYWDYNIFQKSGVNFEKYFLTINWLLSDGFSVPGFHGLRSPSYPKYQIFLSFKNNRVSHINIFLTAGDALESHGVLFDANTVSNFQQMVKKNFSASYQFKESKYMSQWTDGNNYPAVTHDYNMENSNYKASISAQFLPNGLEGPTGHYKQYRTTLQNVQFVFSLK